MSRMRYMYKGEDLLQGLSKDSKKELLATFKYLELEPDKASDNASCSSGDLKSKKLASNLKVLNPLDLLEDLDLLDLEKNPNVYKGLVLK